MRDPTVLAELGARPWSASSLELWIACPARWFVERMLRPERPEPDPEPMARGGLAHAVLRDTLGGLRERVGSARVTPARLGVARELLGEALARREAEFPLSARAERVPGARRRLEADLERYLAHMAACASAEEESEGSRLEPRWLELEFGFDDPVPTEGDLSAGVDIADKADRAVSAGRPVWEGGSLPEKEGLSEEDLPEKGSLPAAGGVSEGNVLPEEGGLPALDIGGGVMLRGRIDRIDVAPTGEAVVYDYKGARVTPGARWIEEGKIQLALYMRAAERLLGVRVVGGLYQPLGGTDLRARGALDGGAGVALECVRTDAMDAGELDALVEQAIARARTAAAEARAGALQARPRTCAYAGGCAHPAICGGGR